MFRVAAVLVHVIVLMCAAGFIGDSHAAALSADAQARVRAATFEVVMKKPESDSLRYERPLPLDLLPYIERTDKYISIGTAFAIDAGRFITAAHVISEGFITQYGQPALRSSDGVVYEIDRVLQYSAHQDFAVLKLKDAPAVVGLEPNREPRLDSTVFAVGNALGEGIVVRDGLLTSLTPEERDGRWKWLRFSAAASPGNSGGPLLDAEGRVIGVVLRKSENENLNYASPISAVLDAPENLASIDDDLWYQLPIMDQRETTRLKKEIRLPLSFADFAREHNKAYWDEFRRLRAELVRKHEGALFPRGEGAATLLHTSFTSDMLSFAGRKSDGTWEFFYAEKPSVAQLGANGFLQSADLFGQLTIRIRRPDNSDAQRFYFDSAAYMDTILKALPWQRTVGREEVRIVSMGKALRESEYIDPYGRKWQQRIWRAEFSDQLVISMALPTPDGYVAMLQWVATSGEENTLDDMRTLASVAHVGFTGSLAQWQEYLALKKLHPKLLDDVRINYELGKSFDFSSPRFEFGYTNAQQKIGADSILRLGLTYLDDGGAVNWDVKTLTMAEDAAGRAVIIVLRHDEPPAHIPQEFSIQWQKVRARQHPFNATVIHTNGASAIGAIYPYPSATTTAVTGKAAYHVLHAREGTQTQEAMQAALASWFSGLKVRESAAHAASAAAAGAQ